VSGPIVRHPEIVTRLLRMSFLETKETLGDVVLLKARDLNHAIALMSKHPAVRMVTYEIRPADGAMNRLVAERSAPVAKEA
jgi:hypothetical protein